MATPCRSGTALPAASWLSIAFVRLWIWTLVAVLVSGHTSQAPTLGRATSAIW